MANITGEMVKKLREMSGAGMMDCKKALTETAGDIEAAVDWLRLKGLSKAAKKSGRVAAEGLVGVSCSGTVGAMVEVNAETDFVARNGDFQNFVTEVSKLGIQSGGDLDKLSALDFPKTGRKVSDELTHMIATIGENMTLRRVGVLSVGKGVVASYIHNAATPGLGKIGVLVALESEASEDQLLPLAKQIAMHVAAASPSALNIDSVDASELERERTVQKEKALSEGKPAEFVDKMVEGRIRKFYEEIVLEEQIFVIDGKTKIKEVVQMASKEAGSDIKLAGYLKFTLGEGIEKDETDFAAEVAAQLNK